MTNTGYWLVTRKYEDKRIEMDLYKEITIGTHNEITLISAYAHWNEWRTVASGKIAERKTRLWALPNHYTIPITIKPITLNQLKKICPEEYEKIHRNN